MTCQIDAMFERECVRERMRVCVCDDRERARITFLTPPDPGRGSKPAEH
jgi:hypothetical protein